MLILHTSDWHLGRSLHGADLDEATSTFLDWLIDLVAERRIDAVLVSGDVFDRAVPTLGALSQLSDGLSRLCGLAPVVLTPGNHDSATRLGFGAGLYRPQLRVVSDPREIGSPVELTGADRTRVLVYPIPYLEPDLVRHVLSDTDLDENGQRPALARSHEAVMAAALRRIGTDLAARRTAGTTAPAIAMIHAFVVGGRPSDSERDIQVGGVPSVPAQLFDTLGGPEVVADGLDYVAAGHLHRPQDIRGASVPIRYSGSPIAYSFSEADAVKSVTLLDVGPGGLLGVEALPAPVTRGMSVLSGPMEDLLSDKYEGATDDFVSATATDDVRPPEMVARIRHRFPHALVILHSATRAPTDSSGPLASTARSPRATAVDFFSEVGGRPLDDAERELLDRAWSQTTREATR